MSDSLYLSNLSYDSTEESLSQVFPDSIGTQVIRDRETNRSRGFGFVQFSSPEEAAAALEHHGSNMDIDGREVTLNYARAKEERGGQRDNMRGGRRGGSRGGRGGGRGGYGQGGGQDSGKQGNKTDSLYLRNLNYESTEDSLTAVFPDSVSAQVIRDRRTNRSRGFGFVQFSSAEEAKENIERLGGPGSTLSIDGRDVTVNY